VPFLSGAGGSTGSFCARFILGFRSQPVARISVWPEVDQNLSVGGFPPHLEVRKVPVAQDDRLATWLCYKVSPVTQGLKTRGLIYGFESRPIFRAWWRCASGRRHAIMRRSFSEKGRRLTARA
jgi:hypothetical protein